MIWTICFSSHQISNLFLRKKKATVFLTTFWCHLSSIIVQMHEIKHDSSQPIIYLVKEQNN